MKNGLKTRELVMCALFAALTAVCSQIQIPLPMVPINLALLAVVVAGGLLRPTAAALSQVVYVLMGLVGLPVFAGFSGGAAVLFGKTGGYIFGYILAAWLTAFLRTRLGGGYWKRCLFMALSVLACYVFGTAWFMVITGMSLGLSLTYCVLPFLPGDAVKVLLGSFLVQRLELPLKKALDA